MTDQAVAEKGTGRQGPFGVRIDHPRNCDIVLQGIPGSRLRSDIRASRTTQDAKTGAERIPQDQARHLGMLGEVPGMEIHVNPGQCSYLIHDPLTEDGHADTLKRIQQYRAETMGTRDTSELKGVPDQSGKLDQHRMKTLCRELFWLIDTGEARLIKGQLSGEKNEETRSLTGIDKLPGHYLLNPGSTIPNTQPQFEKDYESYVSTLNKTG